MRALPTPASPFCLILPAPLLLALPCTPFLHGYHHHHHLQECTAAQAQDPGQEMSVKPLPAIPVGKFLGHSLRVPLSSHTLLTNSQDTWGRGRGASLPVAP